MVVDLRELIWSCPLLVMLVACEVGPPGADLGATGTDGKTTFGTDDAEGSADGEGAAPHGDHGQAIAAGTPHNDGWCGDGIVGEDEVCDDGNGIDADDCTNHCTLPRCGDGIVSPDEVCDDGNLLDTDACTNACHLPICGDGHVWTGVEACDEGPANDDMGACTTACLDAVCGDGLVWAGVEVCDDGNLEDADGCSNACLPNGEAPVLQLSVSAIKRFDFSWAAVAGADTYQLLESAEPGAPYAPVGAPTMATASSLAVPLHLRWTASYLLRACGVAGCVDSTPISVTGSLADAVGYFKASNPRFSDRFGIGVALSGDGDTMAVGADGEDSASGGIDGNQLDDSFESAGAVYVFVRDGSSWSQQAYIKAAVPGIADGFGGSVALSDDGDTLVVGALGEDGAAAGVGGNEADDSLASSGAAYVFVRSAATWSQQAYLKASNPGFSDNFGGVVALSGDGDVVAAGARWEDGGASGIDGVPDESIENAGAVYLFERDGTTWSGPLYVKASNPDAHDGFGRSVALSGDGHTLVVGSGDDSAATGIDGDQWDGSAPGSGATYVFTSDGEKWSQQAYLKASNTQEWDYFGEGLSLSHDGNTLAVGARAESSAATGIDGDQGDDAAPGAGAVYLFERIGGAWAQHAYIKASNSGAMDHFGQAVALSDDGTVLAVAAYWEDSNAIGIGGTQGDVFVPEGELHGFDAGAVYVFVHDGAGTWSEHAYVKASNTDWFDELGKALALSGDGTTLAVGARFENSGSAGIGGLQADESLNDAGAVYLY